MTLRRRLPTRSAAPSCALDAAGLEAQLERYRRLGRDAVGVRRAGERVLVQFGDEPEPRLLAHALEVEGRCCPFVHAVYDPGLRQLTLTVETAAQRPILDTLSQALSSG